LDRFEDGSIYDMVGAAEALGGSMHDSLEDAIGIFVELIVPDAEDRPAFLRKERVAPLVVLRLCMLASVELDDQLGLSAGEVGEVWAYGKLPREFRAQARDHPPELSLVSCRAIAQLTCTLRVIERNAPAHVSIGAAVRRRKADGTGPQLAHVPAKD
jgi:hypothetical protein